MSTNDTILDSHMLELKAIPHWGYAGVGIRLLAFFIDLLITLPVFSPIFIALYFQKIEFLLLFAAVSLTLFWYHVHLVKLYGGTPGKRLLKLRILKLDETKAGWMEAVQRYMVTFVLLLAANAAFIFGYLTLNTHEVDSQVIERLVNILILARAAWIGSEFLVLLTNKKNRSLQDYMARTIVVREIRDPKPSASDL